MSIRTAILALGAAMIFAVPASAGDWGVRFSYGRGYYGGFVSGYYGGYCAPAPVVYAPPVYAAPVYVNPCPPVVYTRPAYRTRYYYGGVCGPVYTRPYYGRSAYVRYGGGRPYVTNNYVYIDD